MNPSNWIVSAVAVALFSSAVYLALEVNSLTDRVAELDVSIAQEAKARTDEAATIRTELDTQVRQVAELGTTDQIARQIVDESLPKLADAVAALLTSDPAKAARLRGETGPSPTMEDVISALEKTTLVEAVANMIWQQHYRELAVMPEVVSTVAEAVYRTYGDELRGMDGKPADATAVAKALAGEPEFLSLMELVRQP